MTRPISLLISLVLAACLSTATAAPTSKLDKRLDSATSVLRQLDRIPEQGIPPKLLRNAYGVAVIPNVIKGSFMVGGAFGKGVLVVRRPDGSWSNPAFIAMGAGSFGFQIGGQSSDIVLVFKTRKSVDNITNGKLTLGGDAAVAAGPVGRYSSAATDGRLRAEIYSYSRNRGLFAGVSLEGGWIGMDTKANFAFYEGQGTPQTILHDEHLATPAYARRFIETLAATAPSLEWQDQASRTAEASISSPPPAPAPESNNAQTYPIDETTF